MKGFLLPYGKERLKVDIGEEHLAGVLVSELHGYKAPMEGEQLVQEALEHPIGTPRLCDMAVGKNKIVVISSDHTRPVPRKVYGTSLSARCSALLSRADFSFSDSSIMVTIFSYREEPPVSFTRMASQPSSSTVPA